MPWKASKYGASGPITLLMNAYVRMYVGGFIIVRYTSLKPDWPQQGKIHPLRFFAFQGTPVIQLLFRTLLVASLAIWLAACGGESAPSEVPTGFKVTAGDTLASLAWDAESDKQYWVYVAQAPAITQQNYSTFPERNLFRVSTSPYTVANLTNGKVYSFMVAATKDGSAAGPATPSIAATPRAAGNEWSAGTGLPAANDFRGVAFGASNYVAVGTGGAVFKTVDGATWTAATSNTTTDLNAIAYSATGVRLLAVGANGAYTTSTDATAWSAGNAGTTATLNGIAFGAGTFVAVGTGGTILTTSDGGSWTARTSGTTNTLLGVSFVNALFVATGASGTLLTSTDGTTWTARTTNVTTDLHSATFGSATYVAVGKAGTVITSADAVTWATQAPPTARDLYSITAGSQFVTVGANSTILYGTNGTSWLPATVTGTNNLNSVNYAFGLYSAVGNAGANARSF